jgi:isoleucyl-tRNA synthetase
VDDPSVYVRFPVKPETTPQAVLDALAAQSVAIDDLPGLSLVVWTTTPWTLPSNTMAAVHPELTYAVCRSPAGPIIVAQDAVERFQNCARRVRFLSSPP